MGFYTDPKVIVNKFLEHPGVDVPMNRRDITKIQNIRWLKRNLAIRNEVPLEILKALSHLEKEK